MSFRFQNPESFQLLWLILVIVVATLVVRKRQTARLLSGLGARMAPILTASVSVQRRNLKLILQLIVFALMIVALARPQQGAGKTEVKSRGVEIIFAVDVSNSMLAEDYKPNRLEHAKRELNRLLDRLSGDKVGIIAFAGSAVLVSPLTTDYSAVRLFIESLSPDSVSTQGTNFRKVIEEAKDAFRRGGLGEDDGVRTTRVLLIATDGEDHEEAALKTADKVSEKGGLRIFTLGFGTRKGAPIPVRDERGNLTGYKKDRSGQIILSQTNEEELSQLAKFGRGSYTHASVTGDEIQVIKADLDKLEKSDFESQMMTTYNEKYQPFLVAALLLGLLELALGERRKNATLWKGRFEVAQK